MPGKIKLRIISARNLPIMDRSSDSSDAFVEVRFGANIYDKTSVCKKSLDPEWNSRFVFEVEEDEIQEEPLQIRVLDHDTYSSHDAIGKVYIDLKPLLNTNGPTSISGWFPIYDTMHGIRGEIKIQAKVEIFNDCNEYRKSSCGVQFFCSPKVPEGYILEKFCGFVEELVINDDPEYQWIDKIRTPRTSNETRQKLFFKLSGEVQRRIGLKVLDMEANSVLGYLQNFDLEGEHGIVVRGIGTAAFIYKHCNSPLPYQPTTPPFSAQQSTVHNSTQPTKLFMQTALNSANLNNNNNVIAANNNLISLLIKDEANNNSNITNNLAVVTQQSTNGSTVAGSASSTFTSPTALLHLNKLSPNRLNRNHSDSDLKLYQQQMAQQQLAHGNLIHQNSLINPLIQYQQNELANRQSILEKLEFPFLTIQHYPTGFIKSLSGIVSARSVKLLTSLNSDELLDVRDKWWTEIRKEIYSHMKSLNCHVVLGYTETQSICEDVCVLSASGTAAVCDETFFLNTSLISNNEGIFDYVNNFSNQSTKNCKICHAAYSFEDLPFPVHLSLCNICGQGQVPDVLFTSIQPIAEIETIGQGCLLRAIVTRPRKKCSGEISAKIISDSLPFIEYELHRQLLGKLKLKGMNLLYGLKVQISIGENLLIAISEATACFSSALPAPIIPKIMSEKVSMNKKEMEELENLKKLITDEMNKNKDFYNLKSSSANQFTCNLNNDESISSDSKALFKIELDDIRDKASVFLLLDSNIMHKKGFYNCSTEFMPGIYKFNSNIQMFTTVYRCETSLVELNTEKFNEICDEIMVGLQYKFRKYANCCLSNLSFDSSLYDDDHAMIIVTGCCLTFSDISTEISRSTKALNSSEVTPTNLSNTCTDSETVEITNLSYVPNCVVENYLGHINLFLIRESTQIKENGGLSSFMHCFISEVLALTRAHVKSLGGNALVSFKMNECILLDNPHRNHGQCLINVAGDAIKVVKKRNSL